MNDLQKENHRLRVLLAERIAYGRSGFISPRKAQVFQTADAAINHALAVMQQEEG